jgi:prevent-host-death family protein
MVKRMSVREARANFADLIGSVQHTGEAVVIERRGKPIVAVVPAGDVGPPRPRWDPAIDAEIDVLLTDAPALRAVVEAGRQVRRRLPGLEDWDDVRASAREDYVAEKVRKKGLAPKGADA